MAYDSPALQANFYVSAKFDLAALKNLSKVKDQLVGLYLNKMPIKDTDIGLLSEFSQLEKLQLSGTQLDGSGLGKLLDLKKLEEISLSSTRVSYAAIATFLAKTEVLKKIYLWNTALTKEDLLRLKGQFLKIQIEEGFVPGSEKMRVNPPILVNENLLLKPGENLQFKHIAFIRSSE